MNSHWLGCRGTEVSPRQAVRQTDHQSITGPAQEDTHIHSHSIVFGFWRSCRKFTQVQREDVKAPAGRSPSGCITVPPEIVTFILILCYGSLEVAKFILSFYFNIHLGLIHNNIHLVVSIFKCKYLVSCPKTVVDFLVQTLPIK